tara:strand:- start:1346 stop:1732 length:387 start_codon:yes stop_codon:yes gene_type:complete
VEIPTIDIPPVQKIKTVEIPLPTADVPYYVPMVVPPSDLRDEQGVKPKATTTETPPAPKLKIPNLPPIPIPSTEVLVTTSIAAVTAVAATTFTQPIIENVKKKVQKFLQGKINKWKENRLKKKKRKDS